jgi:hypothetical protein
MLTHPSPVRAARTRLFSLLAALAAALSVSAVAAAAAAADTGSYTLTSFPTPALYNEDMFIDGHAISPPVNVPATATITSVSISLDWVPKPNPPGYYSSNTDYSAWLCLDAQDTQCTDVGPAYSGQSGWTATTSDLNGLNAATTTVHLVAGLFDSNPNGTYKKAINPFRYVDSESMTVNYTY